MSLDDNKHTPTGASEVSRQIEKAIKVQKMHKMLESLDAEKRSINKLMNTKIVSAQSISLIAHAKLNYLKLYDDLKSFMPELEAKDQEELMRALKLQSTFLTKIQKKPDVQQTAVSDLDKQVFQDSAPTKDMHTPLNVVSPPLSEFHSVTADASADLKNKPDKSSQDAIPVESLDDESPNVDVISHVSKSSMDTGNSDKEPRG